MFINIQLCQSTDINLKLALFWKGIAQFVIKPVDSLDHQDIIFSKLKLISPVFPVSGLKIKSRKIHFLSIKKIQHILIKLLDINGFQALKILFPEFIKRGMLPVHEIIIHTDGVRLQAMSCKLNGQPVGKTGLS